ncbi:MAG: hypothetical protein ACOCZB_03025 [Spirochaetota bacterium]
MKRAAIVAVLVLVVTAGAFALDGGFDVGLGGTFEYGDNIVSGPLSVGAEAGVFLFMGSNEEGDAVLTPLVDVPLRGFARATFGGLIVQGHVGYNFATFVDLAVDSGIGIAHKLDLGARVVFDVLYIEADWLYWAPERSSTRVGVGIQLTNLF